MLSQKVLSIILNFEQSSKLVDQKYLLKIIKESISTGTISFILFSCLATDKNKELDLDFFNTSFFYGGKKSVSKSVHRLENMAEQISALGIKVTIISCLADLEPKRVWGWPNEQEELTTSCELMCEEASSKLSTIWQPTIWSHIENQYDDKTIWPKMLMDLESPGKHKLLIDSQEKHLLSTQHHYHLLSPREVAKRRVASYGLEGLILEKILPNAIFIQISNPYKIRDPLHQRLRLKPLAIIHPLIPR